MKEVDPIFSLMSFLAVAIVGVCGAVAYASAVSDNHEAATAAACLRAGKEWRLSRGAHSEHECVTPGVP